MGEQWRNEEHIHRIVDEYLQLLFRIAFLQTKNKADAEDIVQDVLLKLLNKTPVFDSREHEKAWLIRVATNRSRDLLKTAWFKKTSPLDESFFPLAPEQDKILAEVMDLPAKYREVVFLFYYEGYSIAEIAEIQGQKETTIGSQLHRARKMLKLMLSEEWEDEKG